ncbi:FAD-dependent monooxygenase [Flammeovirga sp. SubArs3]|uniref:NAD(P)/FAD-dependent oxidoreductase n=1 Tax=Flammeovirga sp. SubArs3 TaxID=2995316 RepID=UPI00248D20F9|nr:FAD-dependent monooxygenase [Flammeovirga sp. SubArs3]
MYDVIIIGGGLGGLTLSIQLAKSGWNTLLIEQKKYPFHRVCGEYISDEAWGFLNRLGIDHVDLKLPQINKLKVSAVDGTTLEAALTVGGKGISRYLLDHQLYQIAIDSGVTVHTSEKVTDLSKENNRWFIKTNKSDYLSRVVIGAFGKRSLLDKLLQRDYIKNAPLNYRLKNFIGVKYHLRGEFPNDVIELHNFRGGYCGISKVEEDKICMCFLSRGSNLKEVHTLDEIEKKYLSQNPFLEKYLQYERLWDKPLSIAQVDFSNKKLIENEIPMLGDAAGLIAPLCGNGMSMAMQASVILHKELDNYLHQHISWNNLKDNYTTHWKDTFHHRLKTGRFIQRLFGDNMTTNILLRSLKFSPFITEKIIRSTHGNPF